MSAFTATSIPHPKDWQDFERKSRVLFQCILGEGVTDGPLRLREIEQEIGRAIANECRAAEANDQLFLSEDMGSRAIGREGFQVRTSWLQPVLMIALQKGLMPRDRYNDAILTMLDYRASYVSVDSGIIVSGLGGTSNLPLPKKYLTACNALGGPKAEMVSHVSVVLDALAQIWNQLALPDIVRCAATGALMEALLRHHWAETDGIIKTLRDWGRKVIQREFQYQDYINGWLRGHFIHLG